MQLTEIGTIPPGAQLWSPSVMTTTKKYFIFASTHSIYIYQRSPIIVFQKAISLNNAIICAMAANETYIVAAGNDKKVYFYDITTFEPVREVLLARSDPPISVQFHHHIKDTVLLIYKGIYDLQVDGELRSINIISGQSVTLVGSLDRPIQMICSPHRAEVSIAFQEGSIKQFGIAQDGLITYERDLLKMDLQILEQAKTSSQIINDQTPASKQIIEIINDFRKSLKEEHYIVACTGISYDPKSSDYFLACWSFGIHVLFSSLTGQALQMYHPQTTGITSINYSQTVSGRFYTTDGTTGVYREWNVSQNKQTSEHRVSGTILFRTHVGGYNNKMGATDALHFVDKEGKVTVIEPHTQKILFETKQNHSEAVLSIDIDPLEQDIFCTSSYDGTTRQWGLQNFNYKSDIKRQQSLVCTSVQYHEESITQKVVQNKRKQFQFSTMESGVQSIYIGNVVVAAYKNGLIVAFDKKTGRPIINVFSPDTQYKSTLVDSVVDIMTDQEVSIVQQKSFQKYFRIKCMVFQDEYLYTGWRDSSIRIMKISILESEKHGIIVTSSFVASISLVRLLGMSTDRDLQISHIHVLNNLLYVCTTKSLFLVFDTTQFKKQCSSISKLSGKEEVQFLKTTFDIFKQQKFFTGNMTSKYTEGQIITNNKSIQDAAYSDKKFNSCIVYHPSQQELKFFNEFDQSKPDSILQLVDNEGNCSTLIQIGEDCNTMVFKIISVHSEKLKGSNTSRQTIGLLCIQQISDFHVVIGGQDGILSVVNWKNKQGQKLIASLKSTKSDITTCHIVQNNILIGCFDGSIKIINYHMAGVDSQNFLNIITDAVNNSRQLQEQELIYCKDYFGDVYSINSLLDILHDKTNPLSSFSPLSSTNLVLRSKLILFVILYQFCSSCGIKLEQHITFLQTIAQQALQTSSEGYDLYQLAQTALQNQYNIYNQGQLDTSQPTKQKLQQIFKYVMQLCLSLSLNEILVDLFWELGLYQEAVLTSQFVSIDCWKEKSTQLTLQRMSQSHQQTVNTISDRYQFGAQISSQFFKHLRQIKDAGDVENLTELINSMIKTGRFASAKIILGTLTDVAEEEKTKLLKLISFGISAYFCSVSQPIFGIYELLQEGFYIEAVNMLILSGEYQLLLFILLQLNDKGFSFPSILTAVLLDQNAKFGDFHSVSTSISQLQIDQTGTLIDQELKISDLTDFYTLNFDFEKAKIGFESLKKFEVKNFIEIGHYLRYLIQCEICNLEIPSVESDEIKQIEPVSAEMAQKLILRFQTNQNLPFCKQTFKQINLFMLNVELSPETLVSHCSKMQWIVKHLQLTNCKFFHEYSVTKCPCFARFFIVGAGCSLRINQFKAFRSMISGSTRAVKKMNLQAEEILTVINEDVVKFFTERRLILNEEFPFEIEFNGRSIFENAEKPCYGLFCPMDKSMVWQMGIFN